MKKFFSALPDRTLGALLRTLSPRSFERLLQWLVRWYMNRRQWEFGPRTAPDKLRMIFAFDVLMHKGIIALADTNDSAAQNETTDLTFFLKQIIRPGDRVLHGNCGRGVLTRAIAEYSEVTITGIDRSTENITRATTENAHEKIDYVCGDLFGMPEDVFFDVVVLSVPMYALEEQTEQLQRLCARYCPRVFLLHVPRYDHEQDRVLLHNPETLAAEFAQAGLRIEKQLFTWDAMWTALVSASAVELTTEAE